MIIVFLKAGITQSSFFVQFSCINVFGAITSRRYFLAQFLARRKCLVFFANKLLKLSEVVFCIYVLGSSKGISLKFVVVIVILCALAILCDFSFAKMILAHSQTRKDAAIQK